MALVPWTDEQKQVFISAQFAAQQDHYAKKYPAASHDIIVVDNRPVGRLYVARLDQEIRIVDITVLPAERNAGIGSYLIRKLLDEANRAGKVTRIYVEEFNPSLRLFERLGFSPSEQHGIHLLMQCHPNQHLTP
jgi:GNAT superfamily N-acetyltransferase